LIEDDGWPRALQTCKANGSTTLLDKYKKGSSKAKGKEVYDFWVTFVVDCIKNKSLQK